MRNMDYEVRFKLFYIKGGIHHDLSMSNYVLDEYNLNMFNDLKSSFTKKNSLQKKFIRLINSDCYELQLIITVTKVVPKSYREGTPIKIFKYFVDNNLINIFELEKETDLSLIKTHNNIDSKQCSKLLSSHNKAIVDLLENEIF